MVMRAAPGRAMGSALVGHFSALTALAIAAAGCPPAHENGDAGAADGGRDAGAPTCREQLVVDQPFDIDPEGLGTQIHADAVFDGEGVWVVYNQPDDDGKFEVYLTKLDCAGNVLVAPQRVNTTTGSNCIDPGIALVDAGLVMAWTCDNQTGLNNMDVYFRTFDRTGAPTMATDRTLETTHQDNPVTGNVMDPALAPLPGGAFAIAGIRGLDVTDTFQVFVQRLTATGELDRAALDVVVENGVTHRFPTLAATAAGDLYLAYSTESGLPDVSLVHAHLPASSASWNPLPPALVAASAGGSVGSYGVAADGRVLLAYDVDNDIFVRDGSSFTAPGRTLTLGAGSGTDYAARLVLAPGGGAVFWYRNQSGYRNAFRFASFVDDGTTLTAGAESMVTASPVPPYAPAATHVDGTIYFAAWSEGTSPNFVLRGKFIDLAD